jgi:hypothetical protein
MIFDVRRGLVVVTCVSVGFVVSAGPGLVARAAEPERWVGALTGTPAARDESAQRRIAELEQLVKELEAERSGVQQRSEKSSDLAAAMARNEQLAARNQALSLENQELAQSRAFERPAPAAACEPPSNADPAAQLRYWAKQLRDGETESGRLTPERNAAVNVLLRRERQLDPRNPWRDL